MISNRLCEWCQHECACRKSKALDYSRYDACCDRSPWGDGGRHGPSLSPEDPASPRASAIFCLTSPPVRCGWSGALIRASFYCGHHRTPRRVACHRLSFGLACVTQRLRSSPGGTTTHPLARAPTLPAGDQGRRRRHPRLVAHSRARVANIAYSHPHQELCAHHMSRM